MKELVVDPNNPQLKDEGMHFKEFYGDYSLVRYYASYISQEAPKKYQDGNLLEQQISEVIKNACKHGNRLNPNKRVRVWYNFEVEDKLHIIVEDEGEGFKDLEKWNEFNQKRIECFEKGDFENMEKYVSYRTERSDEDDGGNSLFAAVEYWNGGLVYNTKKNKVSCVRYVGNKKPEVQKEESKADDDVPNIDLSNFDALMKAETGKE